MNKKKADWPLITGLLLLSLVPFSAGMTRLITLALGVPVTHENARFVAMPLPVVIHIVTATFFCVVGAFQFAPGVRRQHPGWHRLAGRVLVVFGLGAALSGLWMTLFYPLHAENLQGPLLFWTRIFVGTGMAASIALSLAAVLKRNVKGHRAWMIRGYALGQGAGTQVFTILPWVAVAGSPPEFVYDLLMLAGWLINLAAAEWVIRRRAATSPYPTSHRAATL